MEITQGQDFGQILQTVIVTFGVMTVLAITLLSGIYVIWRYIWDRRGKHNSIEDIDLAQETLCTCEKSLKYPMDKDGISDCNTCLNGTI
jgi:hypothetical protein